MPPALIAVISFSADSRPKAMIVAVSTAHGTESAIIHAKFRKRNSRIVPKDSPLLINLPSSRKSKFRTNMELMTRRAKEKGPICSLTIYFGRILIIKRIGHFFVTYKKNIRIILFYIKCIFLNKM